MTSRPEVSTESESAGDLATSAAKLLGSGVVSALALTIITSNRWQVLDPGVGVDLVLFLQWQVFGLTLTKLGVDQVIFAAVSENPARVPSTSTHMRSRTLPLGLTFALVVSVVFGPWAGVACFASLLLDTHATFMLADLNARQGYTEVMIANLLNYPLFFIVVFGLQMWSSVTLQLVLVIFVLTSFTRWAWLASTRRHTTSPANLVWVGNALTGVPPVLNFLLFRADQILLGTTAVAGLVSTVSSDFVRQILFMGRFSELLSGVLTMLTGLLLPRLHLPYPFSMRDLVLAAVRKRWLLMAYALAVGLPLVGYTALWQGTSLPPVLLASCSVSSLLILPANALTYSMIRQGYLSTLIRNLAVAVTAGLAVILAGYVMRAPTAIVLAVPIQLAVFGTLALTRSWLRRQHLYD